MFEDHIERKSITFLLKVVPQILFSIFVLIQKQKFNTFIEGFLEKLTNI